MPPTVSLCDLNHQAIAFVGTCPICYARDAHPPLREGHFLLKADLNAALRTHYASLTWQHPLTGLTPKQVDEYYTQRLQQRQRS